MCRVGVAGHDKKVEGILEQYNRTPMLGCVTRMMIVTLAKNLTGVFLYPTSRPGHVE